MVLQQSLLHIVFLLYVDILNVKRETHKLQKANKYFKEQYKTVFKAMDLDLISSKFESYPGVNSTESDDG